MTSITFHLAVSLFSKFSRPNGRKPFGPGDNVVISSSEHDANAGTWVRLAEEAGVEVRWIPMKTVVDDRNRKVHAELDLDKLEGLVDENTRLVAVGGGSNSLGTLNDIKYVCGVAKKNNALSFVDAVHFAPHMLIDVKDIGCDFLACSP